MKNGLSVLVVLFVLSGMVAGIATAQETDAKRVLEAAASYTRTIDYDSGSSKEEMVRVQGRNRARGGGGLPIVGEQRLVQLVSGDVAWDMRGSTVAPTPAATDVRKLEIWLTPHGFLKAALKASNPLVVSRVEEGNSVTVVSIVIGKYRVNGMISADNVVERVETWIPNPVLGDMLYELRYTSYKDFAGVRFPTRIHTHRGDTYRENASHSYGEIRVTGVTANGASAVLTVPDAARQAAVPSNVGGIAIDPQDNVWISDKDEGYSRWYRYDPRKKEFQTYNIPYPLNLPVSVLREPANVNSFDFLSGTVWGVGNPTSRVLRLDPSTGQVNQYPVPLGSHPHGIAIGGDKAVWYAARMDKEVIRIDPRTGQLRHYKTNVPDAGSRMTADAEGNLWIVSRQGILAKVDYRNGTLTEHATPAKSPNSFAIAADTKRNFIWFDETDAGKIARFDPKTRTFAEFPLPTADVGYIIRVIVDPTNPGRVWWSAPGQIGYVEVVERVRTDVVWLAHEQPSRVFYSGNWERTPVNCCRVDYRGETVVAELSTAFGVPGECV